MRLPFRIPEYAPRITWASAAAREVWKPRIQAINAAWLEVERHSVAALVRPSALQNVTPEELPALMARMAQHGLIVLPLGRTANTNGYQSASRQLSDGEPWAYRCAITQPELAAKWAAAWQAADDDAIGQLLGTPDCCRAFFERVWKRERWMDTTWPHSQGAPPQSQARGFAAPATAPSSAQDSRSEAAQRPSESRGKGVEVRGLNMLWRWHGVRPVSHLPCSPYCERSRSLAAELWNLLPLYVQDWMFEILSWPVKWTALHGIAEITTPIHRTSVPTDATTRRLEVRYMGEGYPVEGAIGTGFPHRTVAPTPAVTLKVARPSAQNPAVNGFSTLAAMQEAHQRLLKVAGAGPYRTVLDLGCGDGTLLSRLPAARRIGVDSRNVAQAHQGVEIVVGDCTDRAFVRALLATYDPDLVVAQRDRNPPETLPGYRVLSYSYEEGAAAPQLIEGSHGTGVQRDG